MELFSDLKPPTARDLTEIGRREGQGQGFVEQLSAMTPPGFPLPGLLQFGLRELLQLDLYGPDEKLLWGVCFDYRDSTFGFEYRKFGLRVLCESRNLDAPIAKEVMGRARALTDLVATYLSSGFATSQIAAGNFTVRNLYSTLDERYRFLRTAAATAYATPPPPPETVDHATGSHTRYFDYKPIMEGGALGTAAVDAYFSRLEHLFCIALAFSAHASPGTTFLEFLSANWPTKARTLLDLSDPDAKKFYDRLLEIRDEWRNPLAHGGFLTGGESLFFHLPRVGALPARLKRTPTGVKFDFELAHSSFTGIIELFDQFDTFLEERALHFAVKWAASGLNVAFDASSLTQYRDATESDETFDQFIDGALRESDRYDNMDF